MSLKVVWNKCQGNVWADLFAVELGHAHFNGLEGVYVIWHGGAQPGHVRVGCGFIRDGIASCRKDPAVLAFKDYQLYVTWAKIDLGFRDGAVRFLAKTLMPKAQGSLPDVPPFQVSLPSEEPEGGHSGSDAGQPSQTWQDLAASEELPTARKTGPVPPPAMSVQPKPSPRLLTDIVDILSQCVQYEASDVLLIPGEPPILRHDGALFKMPQVSPLSPEDCKRSIFSILDERQRAKFDATGDLDCSFAFKNTRFRANVYTQQFGVAAAFRVIAPGIPTPEQLGISPAVMKLADMSRGLVLVTGPTGSGKTTTLAALIEYINKRKKKHIITIEDPIEFVFQNRQSVIDQREVGQHTASFAQALKYTLRQNPDVILVGEMRDRETIDLAIRAAETGHLCLSTLHTLDAPSTIDRIISEFPLDQRQKLCNVLGNVLVGVVSQVLLPRRDGGRICAREVMFMNSAVSTLLRDDKVHQIRGAIESSGHEGMQTLDQALAFFVQQKVVSLEEALVWARSPQYLRSILETARAERAAQKR